MKILDSAAETVKRKTQSPSNNYNVARVVDLGSRGLVKGAKLNLRRLDISFLRMLRVISELER